MRAAHFSDEGPQAGAYDIQVDVIAGERVEGSEQVTVIIEVQGSWHADL